MMFKSKTFFNKIQKKGNNILVIQNIKNAMNKI